MAQPNKRMLARYSGHFIFVYTCPYIDGNGRTERSKVQVEAVQFFMFLSFSRLFWGG
jgi:hypothetical protein